MTASLLTASFNFRVFFQTYKLKSSATVLIYTSPLITLSLREFQQIRIVINYQVSPVLVRNSSCAITSGRRDRIGKAALIADSRQARWRREKDRDAEKKIREGAVKGRKKTDKKRKHLTASALHSTLPAWSFTPLQYLPLKHFPPVGCQPWECPSSHPDTIRSLTGMHKANLTHRQTYTVIKKTTSTQICCLVYVHIQWWVHTQ